MKGVYTKRGVWDRAAKLELYRSEPNFIEPTFTKIDPGANYFVAMIEQMGMKTAFSCEGHPDGFYVMFSGLYSKALFIKSAGYFTVEIEGKNRWSIRINWRHNSDPERVDALRWAADAWEKRFGPLDFGKVILDPRNGDQGSQQEKGPDSKGRRLRRTSGSIR